MPEINFDIVGARKAGATDNDIAKYFKDNYKVDFDVEGARKAGANDNDILSYINQQYGSITEKKNLGTSQSLLTPLPSVSPLEEGSKMVSGQILKEKRPLSIDSAVQKDKDDKNSIIAGLYNTLVSGTSGILEGFGRAAYKFESLKNPVVAQEREVLENASKTTGKNLLALRENEIASNIRNVVEKARSGKSTKEFEQQYGSIDLKNKSPKENIKAILFSAPSQVANMVAGVYTGGLSFAAQSIADNASELEKTGADQKLTDNQKWGYLATQAIVQAALEKFSIDKILGHSGLGKKAVNKITGEVIDEFAEKGIKATTKQIQDAAIKKASQFASKAKRTGLGFLTGAAPEGITEGVQAAGSSGIKYVTNKLVGKEVFDEEDLKQNFWDNILNSTVAGGAFGGVFGGGASLLKNTNKAIRNQIAEAQTPEDLNKIQNDLSQQVELGNITPEEAESANITAKQYAEIAAKIPNTVEPETKSLIIGGIQQREQIKNDIQKITDESKNIDESFLAEKQANIDLLNSKLGQVNDYLDGLVTGVKTEYVQEGDKYFKVDSKGEKIEIPKDYYDIAIAVDKENERKAKESKLPTEILTEEPQAPIVEGTPEEISQPIELSTEITEEPNVSEPLKDVESTAKALDLDGKTTKELEDIYDNLSKSSNNEVRNLSNMVENIQEKNERNSILNTSLENVEKTVNDIMKGDYYFLEKREARETKEVAEKYLGEVSAKEAKKDFKDAFFGNPNNWVADALKMRESVRVWIENGGTFNDLLSSIQKEFEYDGFSEQDAALVIKNKLESLTKKDFRQQQISEAYHAAKADGSNPELVKAVEDLLSKPKEEIKTEQPTVSEISPKQKEEAKKVVDELKNIKLTHLAETGMGAKEADGMYISTEKEGNRYEYKGEGKKAKEVEVDIENPIVQTYEENKQFQKDTTAKLIEKEAFGLEDVATQYWDEIADHAGKKGKLSEITPKDVTNWFNSIKDRFVEKVNDKGQIKVETYEEYLNDKSELKVAKEITNQLKSEGHDALYIREKPNTIEGQLVVFDRSKVKPKEEAKPTEKEEKQSTLKGLNIAEATKIYAKVKEMEEATDAEQAALRYLANGGKVNSKGIDEVSGTVKRARLNTGEKEKLSQEVKSRDYYKKDAKSIDEISHDLWEQSNQKISEQDIKNALIDVINSYNTRLEAAKTYLERYSPEYAEEQYYNRLAEQYKEEYEAEQAELEKQLRNDLDEQIEGEASEEHINNLIKQYEAEFERENKQFEPTSEGKTTEKISSRTTGEKAEIKKTEIEKDFEKAKENRGIRNANMKKFVKDNLDSIVSQLKIKNKISRECN